MKRLPKLCRNPAGIAMVWISGHRYYLGRHSSPEATRRYDDLVSQWVAAGRPRDWRPTGAPGPGMTFGQLVIAYMRHVRVHYRRDGELTPEVTVIRCALKHATALFIDLPISEMGPLRLERFRRALITGKGGEDPGLARTTINGYSSRICRMFRWAVSQELCEPSVYAALAALPGLRQGRTEAREPDPVVPVPGAHVDAVIAAVGPPVAALIRLQLLTGMRPGEAIAMRGVDIDTSGDVWIYTPKRHKTQHRGKSRVIFLGPLAKAIVRPFLAPGQLFPIERTLYTRTIARACKRCKIPHWSPNQLRHAAATRLRARYGIEATRVILGHSSIGTSELYAERDQAESERIMGEIG